MLLRKKRRWRVGHKRRKVPQRLLLLLRIRLLFDIWGKATLQYFLMERNKGEKGTFWICDLSVSLSSL